MNRFLILFLLIFAVFSGKAQDTIINKKCYPCGTTHGKFRVYVENGLFRGLDNPLDVWIGDPVFLKSRDSVKIIRTGSNEFIVNPYGKTKSVVLFAIDSVSKDTIDHIELELKNLPQHKLFVGNARDSSKIRLLPNTLISYHMDEYVPIWFVSKVLTNKIEVEGYSFQFTGNRVPKEIVDDLYELRSFYGKPDLTIKLISTVRFNGACFSRNVSTSIILI